MFIAPRPTRPDGPLAAGGHFRQQARATGKRLFGVIQLQQELRSLALPLFPQRQRFLDGLLFGAEAAALDRSVGEGFLIGGELYFHDLRVPPVVS